MADNDIPNFSLLCPIRGRVNLVREYLESFVKHSEVSSSIEFIYYIDEDDPEKNLLIDEIKGVCKELGHDRLKIVVGPPHGVPLAFNYMLGASRGRYLISVNDGTRMLTQGWDKLCLEAIAEFPDKIFVIGFKDQDRDLKVVTFAVVSREFCDVLGYITPPIFEFVGDVWIDDLARRIGRCKILPEIVFRHINPLDSLKMANYARQARDVRRYKMTEMYRKFDASRLLDYIAHVRAKSVQER